jgi:hypothetical protein
MNESRTADLQDRTDRLSQTWELRRHVEQTVATTPVIDIHTHLFALEFGSLNLSGIDKLLTYHYLIAETFRSTDVRPSRFWLMSESEQADLVWKTLFVENTPLSEAARGVVTVLTHFGLDPSAPDLREARAFFTSKNLSSHVDRVLQAAGVSDIVMTNDPFNKKEAALWRDERGFDSRFHAALRIDPLVNDWAGSIAELVSQGFRVDASMTGDSAAEARRFLDAWIERMKPVLMAVSLPDDFRFPAENTRHRVLQEVVLPTAKDHKLPFALMIGVRRGVNPALRSAGDGVGKADVTALERLCGENGDVRFLATFLSRENQHELCVLARKFANLMPFGCWWFLNNPSIMAEITRQRIELLGTSFIPQHSDARILEQLIYKWKHSRRLISDALYESYERLLASGRSVTRAEIAHDVNRLFSGNFLEVAQTLGCDSSTTT